VIYPDLDDLLHLASVILAGEPPVRDLGLLESAVARPAARYLGDELYSTPALKAAALTQSIAKNHALAEGNKRLSLAAMHSFLWMNGYRLTMSNDEAFTFTKRVASGDLDDVDAMAALLEKHLQRRR